MVAAAYARDLLECIAPNKVDLEEKIGNVLNNRWQNAEGLTNLVGGQPGKRMKVLPPSDNRVYKLGSVRFSSMSPTSMYIPK